MRPQVGQVINNKYRLLRLIGDGGMGSVYEARHEVLGTSVALKFLHAELGKRPGLVQRFLQEARVSAQIQSPHVVRVTDVDQTATGAFMVMEYIEGKTLQSLYEELYKAGLQLSYTDGLDYAMQMLEGVEAAHRAGVVHRDLKPDNVMITLDAKGRAQIKLLDFGIAKLKVSGEYEKALTRPGVIMGTPEYMAPEQAFSADAVDARADIFSLGVIIFEMLGGRRPIGGDDPHQIAGAYLSGQIARLTDLAPDIAGELADAVHRAMSPAPSERWPTVTEMRDAIEPFAIAAKAPSVTPSTSLSRVSLLVAAPLLKQAAEALADTGPAASIEPATPAGQRAVPKTLPPEDGPDGAAAAEPAAHRESTNPADPPAMSDPPARPPTPLGGFAPYAEGAPVPEEAAPFPPPNPPFIPPTRSVAPISGRRHDPAATALASPIGSLDSPSSPAGAEPARVSGAPRPTGTAFFDEPSGAGPVAVVGIPPAPSLAPPVPRPSVVARAPVRKQSPLSSLPAILLLAAGISGLVVGGVYIAQLRAKADDHEDPPAANVVPSTSVAADPPPSDDPPPPTPADTTPVAHPPPKPSLPLKPPGKGSAGPVAPPAPSGTGPTRPVFVIPSVLPIPTSLPLDLPFLQPRPRDQPPPGDPPRQPNRPPRGEQPPPPPRGG